MDIDREFFLLNRVLAGGGLTGEEAVDLVHWLLMPEDDEEGDEE